MLIVNLNPGGIAGGSGAQYFVGDFDGTTFTADNVVGDYTPPDGDALCRTSRAPPSATGRRPAPRSASGPAAGRRARRRAAVEGYLGKGFANSFHDEDAATGTLTSPAFAIDAPVPELPRRRRQPPARPGDRRRPAAARHGVRRLRGRHLRRGLDGDRHVPAPARPAGTIGDQQPVSGYEGSELVNTFMDDDNGTGHAHVARVHHRPPTTSTS